MKKVKIPSASGNTLDGTLIIPEGMQPTGKAILFVHGWMGDEDSQIRRAKPLAELGYICLTFSLSGHGRSQGNLETLTRQDFLDDVISAYDYLKEEKSVNPNEISVASASFGGYLAALLTEKRTVHSLVLRVPANYPDDGFDVPHVRYLRENQFIETWRHKPLSYKETLALQAVHDYPREIFIVESERDTVIPHQTVQNYVDAVHDSTKLTYTVIPEADHNVSEEKHLQQFIQMLVDWFKK